MNSSLFSRTALVLGLGLGAATLTVTSGCLAVAAGAGAAGAVAYVRGDLNATIDSPLRRTIDAAERAIQQLEYAKISESRDAMVGNITARNADDKKIAIRIERAGDNLTKIRIRVGFMGDEALSLAILDKIKAAL